MKKVTIKLVGKKEAAYINVPCIEKKDGSIFMTETAATKLALTAAYWHLDWLSGDSNCFGDSLFYACDELDKVVDMRIKLNGEIETVKNMYQLVDTMRNNNGSISVTFM